MTFSTLGTNTTTKQPVYLYKASRSEGMYCCGLQGSGKSGLIENLCYDDAKQGIGFCVIDPHGELVNNVIARLPANREKDVILLDIRDYQYPFGLNLFTCSNLSNPVAVQEVVDQVMHIFDLLVGVSQETRLILDYLRNCTYVLIANSGYTMADIRVLLQNKTCRQKLLQNVNDTEVSDFWHDYDLKPPHDQDEESASLLRRVRNFLQPLTYNIVGQSKTTIDFRQIMDENKILLVKLDSLRLRDVSRLVGALIISLFLNVAPSRKNKKNLFNIYADEFPTYATEDFVTLIEQARKQNIGLFMAHQNRGQLDATTSNVASKLRDRTLGTKQKIIFTTTSNDAEELKNEFRAIPRPLRGDVMTIPIRTVVSDPITWLTRPHGTQSAIVQKFAQEVLTPFADLLGKSDTSGGSRFPRVRSISTEQVQHVYVELNKLLVDAMQDGDMDQLDMKLVGSTSSKFPDNFEGYNREIKYDLSAIVFILSQVCGRYDGLKYCYHLLTQPELMDGRNVADDDLWDDPPIFYQLWTTSPPRSHQFFEIKERLQTKHSMDFWHIMKADVKKYPFMSHPEFIDHKLHGFYVAKEQIDNLVAFIEEIKAVRKELYDNPIKEPSGRYITIPKPSSDETIANALLRIEQELTHMPNYTARVKILASDGKTLEEHIIKTVDPDEKDEKDPKKLKRPKLYGQPLQDRIARIQAQNRIANPYGYTRPRQDVEEEIVQRQAKLRQPAQPQKTVTPQPQIQRRYPVPQPVQPIAASDSQLEQELMKLWQKARDKGLTTLEFNEWCVQEAQQIDWLKKLMDDQS